MPAASVSLSVSRARGGLLVRWVVLLVMEEAGLLVLVVRVGVVVMRVLRSTGSIAESARLVAVL